jgi:pyridoxal phosphate enzyme (YggS family)
MQNKMTVFEQFYSDLVAAASDLGKSTPLLIAVSKKQSLEKMHLVYGKGQRHFGENYAQELADKANEMPANCCWHFIGPVQSNKIKIIAQHANWIHSLSDLKHVQKLETELQKLNRTINALIQINVDSEESKSGITKEEDFIKLAEKLLRSTTIGLKGIMMLPRLNKSESELEHLAAEIKRYTTLLNSIGCQNCEISLGTSSDYREALKAGSTMIRVGEKIFGKRI